MICILFTLLIESLKWICELIWVSLCLLRSPCGLPPPVDEPREQDCINEAMKCDRECDSWSSIFNYSRKWLIFLTNLQKKCVNTLSQNSIFTWVPYVEKQLQMSWRFISASPTSFKVSSSLVYLSEESPVTFKEKQWKATVPLLCQAIRTAIWRALQLGTGAKFGVYSTITYIIVWPMDANAYQYQSCKDDETTAKKQAKRTQPYSAQSFSIFLHLPLWLKSWRTRLLQVVNSLCQSGMMP